MTLARTSSVVVGIVSLLLLSACDDQKRLEGLEERVASLEASVDKVSMLRASVNAVDNRIAELESALEKEGYRLEALEDAAGNRTRSGSLGSELESLRRDFDSLEADVYRLKRGALLAQP